jgi:hypothetical protein
LITDGKAVLSLLLLLVFAMTAPLLINSKSSADAVHAANSSPTVNAEKLSRVKKNLRKKHMERN